MTPSPSSSTRHQEFWSGCRDELPILVGVAPFGMIYGLLALGAGLSPTLAQAMSAVVFAGSAQVVIAQLVHQGSPGLVVVVTVLVVNLRHALYSASVAPFLRRLSAPAKGVLAYLLTDEAYAVAITRYLRDGERVEVSPYRHFYFFGAGITLWACWQVTTAIGIYLGGRLPESWSLDFTLPLTFIALVVPALKDRASGAAALSAGLVALAALGLPYRLGLIAAALTGVAVGLGVEGRS